MRNDGDNAILKLTFAFSLKIIEFTELLESKRKYNIANQLFRCGTSIGANVKEAQNAESKPDFIHKMKIAAKEADEAEYWLLLCKQSTTYPDTDKLLEDVLIINKMLSKIIASSKANSK
jgi:four helix bundle protein